MSRKTPLDVDAETEALLTELKEAFGVKTTAGVIKKHYSFHDLWPIMPMKIALLS